MQFALSVPQILLMDATKIRGRRWRRILSRLETSKQCRDLRIHPKVGRLITELEPEWFTWELTYAESYEFLELTHCLLYTSINEHVFRGNYPWIRAHAIKFVLDSKWSEPMYEFPSVIRAELNYPSTFTLRMFPNLQSLHIHRDYIDVDDYWPTTLRELTLFDTDPLDFIPFAQLPHLTSLSLLASSRWNDRQTFDGSWSVTHLRIDQQVVEYWAERLAQLPSVRHLTIDIIDLARTTLQRIWPATVQSVTFRVYFGLTYSLVKPAALLDHAIPVVVAYTTHALKDNPSRAIFLHHRNVTYQYRDGSWEFISECRPG